MSILDNLKWKEIMERCTLAKVQLGTGKLAVCLQLKETNTQVILKEFKGDYEYRKFIVEAVAFKSFTEPSKKNSLMVLDRLNNLMHFLDEKEKINDEKIV